MDNPATETLKKMRQMSQKSAEEEGREQAQFAALIDARYVLMSAPPRVALAFAVKAMRKLAEIKAPPGEALHEGIAILRDSMADALRSLRSVPDSQFAIDATWQDRADWFCDCILQFAPLPVSTLGVFVQELLGALGGEKQDDALIDQKIAEFARFATTANATPEEANVQPIAQHLATTIGKIMQAKIASSPDLVRKLQEQAAR